MISRFPPLDYADRHGLLALGGDLEPDTILDAYRRGIFPWPLDEETLGWFSPPKRTVLFFDQLHISRSLAKEITRRKFELRLDTDFSEVIHRCAGATNRREQSGTWITPQIISAYERLHRAGIAHCVAVYQAGNLAGGVYGVGIGAMFAGESMFYDEPNASKIALIKLIEYLRLHGATWIDCQVMTPHMRALGAIEIQRDDFIILLDQAIQRRSIPFASGLLA